MLHDANYFRRSIIRKTLSVTFFISGISIMISLETWLRLMSFVFGNSAVTTYSIIAIFLCGFTVGANYFGKRADKKTYEIAIFMLLNIGLGIYTIFFLLIFPLLALIFKPIFVHTQGFPFAQNIFSFVIAFVFLILPGVLIGGMFPTLGRFFIQSSARVSNEIGNLSSTLTAGAALGSLLTGFVLFQLLGVKQSLVIAGILFLFCGAVVWILLKNIEPKIFLENEFFEQQLKLFPRDPETMSQPLRKSVLAAYSVLGFISASYLVLWQRTGVYLLGTDVYASTSILIITFAGFSIGALIYSRVFPNHIIPFPVFALIPIVLGGYSIFSILLMPLIIPINEILWSLGMDSPFWNFQMLVYFFDAILIFFLPAMLMGVAFVLVNRILLYEIQKRGQLIGAAIGVNAAGAILGLLVIGFMLKQGFGIQKSIVFIALISFVSGLLVLFLYSFQYSKIKRPFLVFTGVGLIFIVSLLIPANKISQIYASKQKGAELIFVREGLNATITAHKNKITNQVFLFSNGVRVKEKPLDIFSVEQISGFLPLLLHPNPETILVIGSGSGVTINNILTHPVKKIDCVEKCRTAVETSLLFNNTKNNFLNNNKCRFIFVNENHYVKFTNQKYDVIINNCYHPSFSGNNKLFCKEYFRACQQILTHSGLISIAVPLYGISIEDFKIILKTFQIIFPSATVWYNNNSLNHYALLIGNNSSVTNINFAQIYRKFHTDSLNVKLSAIGLSNIYEALDCFLMGPDVINKLSSGVRINSKNHPVLEFSTPKTPNEPLFINQILHLFKSYRESVFPCLTNIDSIVEREEIVKLFTDGYYNSSDKVFSGLSSQLMGEEELAIKYYQQAYMSNGLDNAAKKYLDDYYDPLLISEPATPKEFTENAKIYYQKTEYKQAINLLEHAIQIDPNYSPAYFALGLNYEVLGKLETAKQMFQKTLNLKPELKTVKKRLDAITLRLENQAEF